MTKWILLLTLVLILPLVIAANYHKVDTTLEFSITSNNATSCNLTTIDYPLGILTINQESTKSYQTFNFSVDEGNYTEQGYYCHNIECSDGTTTTSGEECYEVNYYGKELKQSQSTIYLGLLGILLFTLFATFWGMNMLPNDNQKDEMGRIMSITWLKYLRMPLWIFAYFLFIGIVYLSSNVAFAFLSEQLFAKLLFSIFVMLFAVAPVVIIILGVSFFVKFYHDKEFQKYLKRGIFPENDF